MSAEQDDSPSELGPEPASELGAAEDAGEGQGMALQAHVSAKEQEEGNAFGHTELASHEEDADLNTQVDISVDDTDMSAAPSQNDVANADIDGAVAKVMASEAECAGLQSENVAVETAAELASTEAQLNPVIASAPNVSADVQVSSHTEGLVGSAQEVPHTELTVEAYATVSAQDDDQSTTVEVATDVTATAAASDQAQAVEEASIVVTSAQRAEAGGGEQAASSEQSKMSVPSLAPEMADTDWFMLAVGAAQPDSATQVLDETAGAAPDRAGHGGGAHQSWLSEDAASHVDSQSAPQPMMDVEPSLAHPMDSAAHERAQVSEAPVMVLYTLKVGSDGTADDSFSAQTHPGADGSALRSAAASHFNVPVGAVRIAIAGFDVAGSQRIADLVHDGEQALDVDVHVDSTGFGHDFPAGFGLPREVHVTVRCHIALAECWLNIPEQQ